VARNFREGLRVIQEIEDIELISVMEDDDWYSPAYLENHQAVMARGFGCGVRVVGEMNTVYYNVAQRLYRQNWHPGHASLCSVCFHRDILPKVLECLENYERSNVDHMLFRTLHPSVWILEETNYVVGIKGIPDDRAGAGFSHGIPQGFMPDPDMETLQALIGNDVIEYTRYFRPQPTSREQRQKDDRRPAKRERTLPPPRPTKEELHLMTPGERRRLKMQRKGD
jgi:hypothetical protein